MVELPTGTVTFLFTDIEGSTRLLSELGERYAGALADHLALAEGPIRVRMGIHTGEAQETEEGYVGLEVHRGARICAAAHGGQVVVSAASSSASPRLGGRLTGGGFRPGSRASGNGRWPCSARRCRKASSPPSSRPEGG